MKQSLKIGLSHGKAQSMMIQANDKVIVEAVGEVAAGTFDGGDHTFSMGAKILNNTNKDLMIGSMILHEDIKSGDNHFRFWVSFLALFTLISFVLQTDLTGNLKTGKDITADNSWSAGNQDVDVGAQFMYDHTKKALTKGIFSACYKFDKDQTFWLSLEKMNKTAMVGSTLKHRWCGMNWTTTAAIVAQKDSKQVMDCPVGFRAGTETTVDGLKISTNANWCTQRTANGYLTYTVDQWTA